MTVLYTKEGCKVETTHVIQPNGSFRTEITMSVDPASALSLAIEERAGQAIGAAPISETKQMRVRATKYGFELVPR